MVGGTPIEMYGESWFVHLQVDIITILYYDGYGTSCIGKRRLSMNSAEVINASILVSSTELDYSYTTMESTVHGAEGESLTHSGYTVMTCARTFVKFTEHVQVNQTTKLYTELVNC